MAFELTKYELSGAIAHMEDAAQGVMEESPCRHWNYIDHLSEDSLLFMCLDTDAYQRYTRQGERLESAQHNMIVDSWYNTIQDLLELNDRIG